MAFRERYRVGFDARTNRRDGPDDAETYSVTLGANRIGGSRVNAHTRSTRYTNDTLEGWLHVVDVGIAMGRRSYLRLEGGVRDETNLTDVVPDQSQQWFGVETELALGRQWYVLVALERTDGDLDQVDQLYARLTYRF